MNRILLAVITAMLMTVEAGAVGKAPPTDPGSIRDQAYAVARDGILENIAPVQDDQGDHEYVLAGAHQYYYYTSRDFAWSSWGTIESGKANAVHDTLELALGMQQADGLIPRDISPSSTSVGVRFFLGLIGIRLPFTPPFQGTFVSENNVVTLDSNVIIPWAASHYIQVTHDTDFARKWFASAENAITFLEKNYYENGLVAHQPPFSDWEDSIARTGRVAYTNELYILALRGMSDWASYLGMTEKATNYEVRAVNATHAFYDFFWMPEEKMIRNFEGDDRLSLDANLIAVAYQLVPETEATEIMETLRGSVLWRPIPGRATVPAYPDSMKSSLPKLSGDGGYHDTQYWIWMTSLAARAEKAVGNRPACETILDQIAAQILKDDGVFENYRLAKRHGHAYIKPFRNLIYHSEAPLTWSCGMVIQALNAGCK